MSLINDALKTAQRERRATSAAAGQPLIEGFFPFVSTSQPAGPARTKRVAILSASFLVVAAAGFLATPSLRRLLTATEPAKIQLPARATRTPDKPVVSAPAVAADTQKARADSAPPKVATDARKPAESGNGPRQVGRVDSTPRPVNVASQLRTTGVPPVSRDSAPVRPAGNASPDLKSAVPIETPTRVDYEALATAAFNAGDLAGARSRFELAIKAAPTARTWTNYGVTLHRLGDLRGARAAYQSALGLDASYLEAWLYSARVAMELREAAVAVPLLQRARAINPRHSGANTDLAQLLSEAKNWSESRKYAEEAVRADPANARAHWFFATAADQLKDADVAIREYTTYLQLVGTGTAESAGAIGYARERLALLRKQP